MSVPSDVEIAQVLMALAHARGTDKTFCPSEAARLLSDDWRPLMARVRSVARDLPLVATQKRQPVDLDAVTGPIRLALCPDNAG